MRMSGSEDNSLGAVALWPFVPINKWKINVKKKRDAITIRFNSFYALNVDNEAYSP